MTFCLIQYFYDSHKKLSRICNKVCAYIKNWLFAILYKTFFLSLVYCLFMFGLPLGVAAERSVHYFWEYFARSLRSQQK